MRPCDVFHREDARGAVIGDGLGHDDAFEILQLTADGGEVVRFLAVIEFAQQALAELIEHFGKLVAFSELRVLIEELGDLLQRVEILDHLFADARALHFHGDLATVAQARLVHLTERRRGHGRGFEFGKRFRKANAQLGGDSFFDLVKTERFDLVLETGERFEISLRH